MAVKQPKSAASKPSNGFSYSREQFQSLIEDTLALARKVGATDAGAEVSEGVGLSVSVRKGKLENVERNRDKSIGVTVYLGQRRGNASGAIIRRTLPPRHCPYRTIMDRTGVTGLGRSNRVTIYLNSPSIFGVH